MSDLLQKMKVGELYKVINGGCHKVFRIDGSHSIIPDDSVVLLLDIYTCQVDMFNCIELKLLYDNQIFIRITKYDFEEIFEEINYNE